MGYSFDGSQKVITLTSGTTILDVKDLYSRWKDWVLTSDNSKWAFAFLVSGGDPVDPGSGTFFLCMPSWRMAGELSRKKQTIL
jgi:hypothetical protein